MRLWTFRLPVLQPDRVQSHPDRSRILGAEPITASAQHLIAEPDSVQQIFRCGIELSSGAARKAVELLDRDSILTQTVPVSEERVYRA